MLIALAMKALPRVRRPQGTYLWLVVAVCALTAATAVFSAVAGIGGLPEQ